MRAAVERRARFEVMKRSCCGEPRLGLGSQPRSREVCEGCGAYLHSCVNCHHFDHVLTNSCKLSNTSFVGSRDSLNYCEQFRMLDAAVRADEERVSRARLTWERLFRR
jgi:hypothetical protein